MGYELVGQSWSPEDFKKYVRGLDLRWVNGCTLHHTGSPSLSQRPGGLTNQHMENIQDFYENKKGWSAGPQLFVDDKRILGMSSLQRPGVHAVSFNKTHIAIEVLGDYDKELPHEGRGLKAWNNAIKAAAAILKERGLGPDAFNFHRDDPKTDKTCPGTRVGRSWVTSLLGEEMAMEEEDTPAFPVNRLEIANAIEAIEWQLTKIKALLR